MNFCNRLTFIYAPTRAIVCGRVRLTIYFSQSDFFIKIHPMAELEMCVCVENWARL